MSAGNLQAALARVLVDDQVLRSLHDDPEALRARFGLTADQLAVLRGLDARRVELTARVGRAKRLDFLGRGLPATLRALQLAGQHATLHDFVRETWAPVETAAISRALSESRRFARYLARRSAEAKAEPGLPPWVPDLAAFEIVKLELLSSSEASAWAQRSRRSTSGADGAVHTGLGAGGGPMVVLGRHVRVVSFSYDVIALSEKVQTGSPVGVLPEPTTVTVVKRRQRPLLMTYRTGEAAAALLRYCAEPRRLAEVLALHGDDRREQSAELVNSALLDGVVFAVSTDAGRDTATGPAVDPDVAGTDRSDSR